MHLTNTFDNSLYFRIEINDESFIMNYEGMLQLFMKFIIQLRFLFFLYCIEKTLYKLKIKKNKPIKRFICIGFLIVWQRIVNISILLVGKRIYVQCAYTI